ncbi:VOC family protein [Actinophytocola sediminis]
MQVTWGLAIDCAHPGELAKFWSFALGYVEMPVPAGYATMADWLTELGVPEEEWDDGAYLSDPDGTGPTLSLVKVPEGKVVKNRVHIDLKVGGGRQTPWEQRWPKVLAAVERLTAAGATVSRIVEDDSGRADHYLMADPEGNEFCVV